MNSIFLYKRNEKKLVKLNIILHWIYPNLKYLEEENMKAVLDMLPTAVTLDEYAMFLNLSF